MCARLIAIEGLPGSGKTTASQMVYDILVEHGIAAELRLENDPDHPADFDGVAYLDEGEFEALNRAFPRMKELEKMTSPFAGGYLVSYRKAMESFHRILEPGLLDALASRDVYALPPDLHRKLLTKRWKDFVQRHEKAGRVYIFECSFIQNPVTFTMVKNNAPEDVVASHVRSLLEIVSPLAPLLLYMRQRDIRTTFLKVMEERPRSWYEGFEAYYTGQGYGRAHRLSGTEGVLRVLEDRARLEINLLSLLPVEKVVVDNSGSHPENLRQNIRRILTEQGFLDVQPFRIKK